MTHTESHSEEDHSTDSEGYTPSSEQETPIQHEAERSEDSHTEDSAVGSATQDEDSNPSPEESESPESEGQSADQQVIELTNDLQRLSAEYTNYRRRVERDRVGVVAQAKAEVVTQLLPLLDDLALAEAHGDLEGPLKSLADKLTSTLTSLGLESYGEPGEEFDPELHEAVQDTSSGDEKVLGTVLRKGFRFGDRPLRTAMVIIADPEQ